MIVDCIWGAIRYATCGDKVSYYFCSKLEPLSFLSDLPFFEDFGFTSLCACLSLIITCLNYSDDCFGS